MQAIILAGGLGTRLRSVVSDRPKCMAEIAGRPFLEYLLDELISYGFKRVILAVGYKNELVNSHFSTNYKSLEISYSAEDEPLGTGGAILQALNLASEEQVFVLNGDTLFRVDYSRLLKFHSEKGAEASIAARRLENSFRHGCMDLDSDGKLVGFHEKAQKDEAIINGGIYLVDRLSFLKQEFPQKFSFEKEYLETKFKGEQIYGFVQDGYFIDIGVPEDYRRAQIEFPELFARIK
jgi:D-glycero-alpha-D-manno-heptose 1-phosphate guanylyltransferase